MEAAETAAAQTGVRIAVLTASTDRELEPAFARLVGQRLEGLIVASDPFFNTRRVVVVALARGHQVPAIYEFREFVEAGGLMSYGANLADGYRQVGAYVGRVLRGARPADLPVLQPTRFELSVNLTTARELGVTIPPSLLLQADRIVP